MRMFNFLLHKGLHGGNLRKWFIGKLLRIMYGCSIDLYAEISELVRFSHNALGVVIHSNVHIGAGTQIEVNVVIGEKQNDPGGHLK